jgi:hypothetical protein
MAKYKNTKQIAKSAKKEISDSKLHKYLIAIPLIALAIKFIVMANIEAGGWYGADGENYLTGVEGLLTQGFFSTADNLTYWPAGYPLLLWPIAIVAQPHFFYMVTIIQSIFFAYATYFLTVKLLGSSLRHLAFWASIILSFNPTLSLSSMAVGYEAPIAACFMMITGTILSTLNDPIDKKFWIAVAVVGSWFALATLMQPRYLLVGVFIAMLWALKVAGAKNRFRIVALITAIMIISPAIMIARNGVATGQKTISTNLGGTMRIGAGSETSGSYERNGPEVPCEPKAPSTAISDNELVACVLKWYLKNPIDTVRLSFNKSVFFWSPWSGPEATGTMARNPWLKISPVQQVGKSNQEGQGLVFGPFGIAISYLWIIGQVVFLLLGYRSLHKLGRDGLLLAQILITPVLVSWLLALGTIGDHRFRIPTMSMSLVLQLTAFLALRKKINDKVG